MSDAKVVEHKYHWPGMLGGCIYAFTAVLTVQFLLALAGRLSSATRAGTARTSRMSEGWTPLSLREADPRQGFVVG